MGCLLVSEILNKNDFGVKEFFSRIKTTVGFQSIRHVTFSICLTNLQNLLKLRKNHCQVLSSTWLVIPAIATLAELAGGMAAVCQPHYWQCEQQNLR